MNITIGTFNLNNLFSRYNFKGEIQAIKTAETSVSGKVVYEFGDDAVFRLRTYKGKLVKGKKAEETQKIANRILSMNVDVLAVQEVEDIDILRQFNRDYLGNAYSQVVLIEGNDPRLIDVGVMSKLPIGAVTSWQCAVHPDEPDQRIFGRDLLQIEIMNSGRSRRLFTLFNNHLKSQFVDFRADRQTAEAANNLRRKRQADMVAELVKREMRPDSAFIILGDMNDTPDSPSLSPFVNDAGLNLSNALANPVETRPAKADTPPPASPAWTHRFKESGQPARYELFDQIWLSPALANHLTGAFIDRRTKHSGDGSDHDPAWITLDL